MPQPRKQPPPDPSQEPETTPTPDPSPSPEPSPSSDPSAEAGSSTGSSAGSRWAVDAGPAFDDKNRPQPEVDAEQDDVDAPLELWDEEKLRPLLVSKGQALHFLLAVDRSSDEWVYTENDLKAIAPPLARMLNRYDVTRAAAVAGDELALGVALGTYAIKNVGKRRQLIAELREQGPVSLTGAVPDAAAGDYDPDELPPEPNFITPPRLRPR